MKQILCAVILLALTGCAYSGPIRPERIETQRVVNASFEKTWTKAIQSLAAAGYPILTASKESGVISTGKKTMRLNETQADCGDIWGLAYVADERTTTNVSQSIILVAQGNTTAVTVNSQIEGIFNATSGGETKNLSCFSKGEIERKTLESL